MTYDYSITVIIIIDTSSTLGVGGGAGLQAWSALGLTLSQMQVSSSALRRVKQDRALSPPGYPGSSREVTPASEWLVE